MDTAAPRALLILGGLALAAVAVWLFLVWVDGPAGYDATCENALRFWTADTRRRGCTGHMAGRSLAAAAFLLAGGWFLRVGLREDASMPPFVPMRVVAFLGAFAAGVLVWSEVVRSGGIWE
ncbi:MAG: hypothetical protein AAF548_05435 [Actinomycetota bacterium]